MAVEVNLFAPYVGMVDPTAVAEVQADGKTAAAVAEDVALAEMSVNRLRADLRVRPSVPRSALLSNGCLLLALCALSRPC